MLEIGDCHVILATMARFGWSPKKKVIGWPFLWPLGQCGQKMLHDQLFQSGCIVSSYFDEVALTGDRRKVLSSLNCGRNLVVGNWSTEVIMSILSHHSVIMYSCTACCYVPPCGS